MDQEKVLDMITSTSTHVSEEEIETSFIGLLNVEPGKSVVEIIQEVTNVLSHRKHLMEKWICL